MMRKSLMGLIEQRKQIHELNIRPGWIGNFFAAGGDL